MSVFNNNPRLQDFVMYAMDWAVFLRHDIDDSIRPFLLLQKGDEQLIRMLVTDGNPMEYALKVLAQEEKPFDQFVMGFEGYISDDANGTGKTDAIIIHGYDRTQDKGVSLAQAFLPKEKGGFKKIGKVQFIGNPDMPLPKVIVDQPDYSAEELGFSGISFKKEELLAYMGVFTHKNPAVIVDGMKRYLRGKLTDAENQKCSGFFELTITPGLITNTDFLKYTILSALEGELESDLVKNWEKQTNRRVNIICKYGDEEWLNSGGIINKTNTPSSPTATVPENEEQDNEKLKARYKKLSEKELVSEFQRIVAIPNARTNITALIQMTALMDAFKERGIPLPVSSETPPDPKTTNSNTIKIFVVLLIVIVLYFLFRK